MLAFQEHFKKKIIYSPKNIYALKILSNQYDVFFLEQMIIETYNYLKSYAQHHRNFDGNKLNQSNLMINKLNRWPSDAQENAK